jgi:hypothetical protein
MGSMGADHKFELEKDRMKGLVIQVLGKIHIILEPQL